MNTSGCFTANRDGKISESPRYVIDHVRVLGDHFVHRQQVRNP